MKTTNKSIYEYDDYKIYLLHLENVHSNFKKGFRSRIAEAIGCKNAYISQVLNKNYHLSLEQALLVAAFLQMETNEEKYFLWLVEYARSGTKELRDYFLNLLHELREDHLNIQNRVEAKPLLSEEAHTRYYSDWSYAGVHILSTIPGYQGIPKISEALKISAEKTQEVVQFLIKIGLLAETRGVLKPGMTQLHLSDSSVHISKHHTNWRIKAIQSLGNKQKKDIHYSTISSLSKKDVEDIRQTLVQVVQAYTEKVRTSREEVLYSFNLDFYNLL